MFGNDFIIENVDIKSVCLQIRDRYSAAKGFLEIMSIIIYTLYLFIITTQYTVIGYKMKTMAFCSCK